jgi:replicative DNA helicase
VTVRSPSAGRATGRTPKRIPPHNLEAEESVLGSMMLSGEALSDVLDVVSPTDHYRPAHRTIHEAILGLYSRGEPVDAITTVEELRRRQKLEEVGGPLFVYNLVETVPTPASARYYARIVADHSLLRRLIETTARIQGEAYAVPDDPRLALERAEQLIYALAHRPQETAPLALGEVLGSGIDWLEALQARPGGMAGIATGFRSVDELLGGLEPGALVIVAARPAAGKSSFVANVARNVAVGSGLPAAFFSLEMSRLEVAMRLLCGDARVSWHRLRTGRVGADEWRRLVDAVETMHAAPLFLTDADSYTAVGIRSRARRLRAKGGLALLVVDYLQLISPTSRGENREAELAEISRSLKLLAKELDLPVIAVSQLNRDPERRLTRRPQLSDLRGSGSLEQDADVVMFIHHDDGVAAGVKPVQLIVAKHRNGPTGDVKLSFVPDLCQFRDPERRG